jgi:putative flippase GtrA
MFLKRALRYLVAGSLTTGLMVGLVTLFDHAIGLSYLLATSLAFILTLGVSYLVHTYWTFRNTERSHVRQFSQHSLLVVVNFVINGGLMYFFVSYGKLPSPLAQLVTSGVIAVESFLVYHLAIFSSPKTAQEKFISTYGN